MAVTMLAVGTVAALAQQAPTTHQVDQSLAISSLTYSSSLREGVTTFAGNVVVTYDVTRIRADKVTIYMRSPELETPILAPFSVISATTPGFYLPGPEATDQIDLTTRRGVAEGSVVLTDPMGTVKADRLEFNWVLGTGRASNVDLAVAGVTIRAEQALLSPGRYELVNVSGSSCPELYSLSSRRVVIRPTQKAVIERPRFTIGPLRLPALPNQTVSLDQRVVGFRLPGVSYKRGEGLGITWNSGILLDTNTALTSGFNLFPNQLPSYGAEIAHSSIPPGRSTGLISPRSELGERFSYGWLENINIGTPESEYAYLTSDRNTVSLGSYWNQGASSRSGATSFSKMVEVAHERGGQVGNLGVVGQLRLHHIQERRGPFQTRLVGQATVGLKPVELAPSISSLIRLNVQAHAGESLYGWARLQLGAVYQPNEHFRLGAAYVMAGETGVAAFEADRLFSFNAFHVRADLDLGPTKASVLSKYDFERKKWYDREYSISQVMGCLEPFVMWREFPSDYRFGLRLRLDDFLDILSRRDFKRGTAAKPKMSGH